MGNLFDNVNVPRRNGRPNSTIPEFADPGILTHPNIPKPLHGVTPRTIKGSGWWNKVRRAAYAVHDDHCHACGEHKSKNPRGWLEAHEVYSIDYARGRAYFADVVALCPTCHMFIHSGRLFALWQKGEISSEFANKTLIRGLRLLDRCNKERGTDHRPFWHTLVFMYMLTGNRSYEQAFNIVRDKGLIPEDEGEFAPWESWRLVFDDQLYPPIYPTERAWMIHFGYIKESESEPDPDDPGSFNPPDFHS